MKYETQGRSPVTPSAWHFSDENKGQIQVQLLLKNEI
jgi:hypothetical protein